MHVLTLATSSATLSCIHALQCMRRKGRALQEVACTSEPKSCLDPCQGLRTSTKKKKAMGTPEGSLRRLRFSSCSQQIANVTPSYGDWLFHLNSSRSMWLALQWAISPRANILSAFVSIRLISARISNGTVRHTPHTLRREVGPRYLPGSHMAMDVTKSNQKTCPGANSKT